jgi:diguanylate cyclase (GGDEF)-like protein
MTLFKQVAIMLSIFLIIILTTVLILNFKSANTSVEETLYEDAKNTATSLSLSLGTANGDVSIMSTMINANYDSGNYLKISLVDVDDVVLYERTSETKQANVPNWFLNVVHIEAPLASANVSAGWSQVGILNVQSDVAHAYTQLYTILKNLLISFGILLVIGLVILNLLLVAILKPLKEVQRQAEAVIRNEFIIQKNIPYTKEFRDVVLGMNNMVSKVKAMFDKGNAELQRQKALEYIDSNTQLKNRKYLIDKLPEYLKMDAASKGGVNMMIAISGVSEANKAIGHKNVDALFADLANVFKTNTNSYEEVIVARLNGTEFAILLPDIEEEDALFIATNIQSSTKELIQNAGLDINITYLSIGIYEYNYTQTIGELLSLSDNVLTQAKFSASHIINVDKSDKPVEVMGKDAWREIIENALAQNNFNFVSWTAVDSQNKKVVHNALSLTLESPDAFYYYGQFMAPANQAGLSNKIYTNMMNMLFKNPDESLRDSTCSIRLSYEYLDSTQTYNELEKLFHDYAKKLPLKLIIEIPDKFARKNTPDVKLYNALFEKYNIEMGIYEFIGESENYQYLQDLRPIYIKGESAYFLTQTEQSLSALRLITDSIGIELIASGVMDLDTLKELQKKDIYTIQGRVTEMIELN